MVVWTVPGGIGVVLRLREVRTSRDWLFALPLLLTGGPMVAAGDGRSSNICCPERCWVSSAVDANCSVVSGAGRD
jgi:hypothetical protein